MSAFPDVTILGAGVIGLTLALELHRRGLRVSLYEPRIAASQASWAAAGMLAAQDPYNPPALTPLARLSAALYPAFLQDLISASGQNVPFQTDTTVQHLEAHEVVHLREHSIDPRQLALALLEATRKCEISLRQPSAEVTLPNLSRASGIVIHATGAWATASDVYPRKGQMLRIRLPPSSNLHAVHRSESVYVVPRTEGPQAGTALIGATVEDVGFNTDVIPEDLAGLRQRGAALVGSVPELSEPALTPVVEAWAGLRPATPDDLPLLGELAPGSSRNGARQLIAAGHFRNGILLAPVTAVVMADLVEGRTPPVDLAPFAPQRFSSKRGHTS